MDSFACGCVNAPKGPEPSTKKTEYFEDVSASLAVHHSGPTLQARYSWLLEDHKGLPPSAYVEAVFENPKSDGLPIVSRGMQVKGDKSNLKRFYFLSPNLSDIECKDYKMTATVYSDRTRQHLITQHSNTIRSRIDTSNCPTEEFLERMSRVQEEWKSA
eukprot:CFRG3930T1